jgi:hypothetical protein
MVIVIGALIMKIVPFDAVIVSSHTTERLASGICFRAIAASHDDVVLMLGRHEVKK